MDKAAILHRPESEMGYLTKPKQLLRTLENKAVETLRESE